MTHGVDQDQLLDEFQASLRQLRAAAGNPSLRTMAGTAHYSHTALSGVTSTHRLPSLDLTLAFVRACGGDVDEWRGRWAALDAAVNNRPAPTTRRRNRRRYLALGPVAVALGALVALLLMPSGHPPAGNAPAGSAPARIAAESRPVASPPLVPGDNDEFVADVTIPDGTSVRVNQRFVKTWAIRNTGTVTWRDRFLQRQGPLDAPALCTSVPRVAVPLTTPGQQAEISVTFTAPSAPGSCRVDWKMTDGNGRAYFPGKGGLYVLVNVTA